MAEPSALPALAPLPAPVRAPDAIEPIVGWRAWRLAPLAGARRAVLSVRLPIARVRPVRLASCSARGDGWIWEWRAAPAAVCRAGRYTSHEAPQEGCSCGYYALNHPRRLGPLLNLGHLVVGELWMWGKVVVCEDGFRSQNAYPRRIVIVEDAPSLGTVLNGAPLSEVVDDLSLYEVPVEVASRAEVLRSLRGAAPAYPAGAGAGTVEGPPVSTAS